MSTDYFDLAFEYAPVLWQKANEINLRGDCITKVDFASDLSEIENNWENVIDPSNELKAHGYYSVVETTTHYFILYAFYHGQDWYGGDSPIAYFRKKFDEHLHDMEGALAVVTKRKNKSKERVDAFITVSHYHFYTYANWKRNDGSFLHRDVWANRIRGFKEDVDGNIWPSDDNGLNRFSLYAQAMGHGIRGDRKKWGSERKIIRYFPSKDTAGIPDLDNPDSFTTGSGGYGYQDVRYKLIDFFEPGGLWENKDNLKVFRANDKGKDAFVALNESGKPTAGSANPPWGWDDTDDKHKCGELAINPAHIVYDYLTGLREYSLEYVYNLFLNIKNA